MKKIEGDLIELAIEGKFDVIVHGCNCFCTMGSGIAKQIRETFPDAFEADLQTEKGDSAKLGNYSEATVEIDSKKITVINAYTQYNYSTNEIQADYKAIEKVFAKIKTDFKDKRIGYPKIGAGLAGGDWNIIKPVIEKSLKGTDHTLVIFKRQEN